MSVREPSARKSRGNLLHHVVHSIMEGLEERRLLSTDIRLIGITGNFQSGDPGFGNDETLYELKYGSPGTSDPAFLDGWEDIASNAPDTKLTVSDQFGVTEGHTSLRVEVDNGVGAFWGIRSGNVVDALRNGATTLRYDMTLLNKELNGGSYGGNGDDSFNGYAQNNELAVVINTPTNGFIQRSFSQANGTDSSGQNATWAGVDGTRQITWDLTTFTASNGQNLQEFITSNNATDARFWIVTQGADTNGHVGPMRFYFDNIVLASPTGDQLIGDFELLTINKILQLPHVPDTDAIGFNPESGLLHRVSGSTSYRDNPTRIGYHDNQFMETINMDDPVNSQVGIFNANYQGELDNGTPTGNFGLPAPFPNWVFPDHRRTDEETDGSFSDVGPNEYSAMRDLTWSNADHVFYSIADNGIFKMTPDGQSTFVGRPRDPVSNAGINPKAATFYNLNGARVLFMTERDGPNLWTIDPATAQPVGSPLLMLNENGYPIPGMVSIVEDPTSRMLLGISRVVGDDGNPQDRLLVRIDPSAVFNDPISGMPAVNAVPLGNFGTYMADLAFVVPQPTVTASSFQYEALPQRLVIKFSQNVGDSLSAADLKLEKLGPGGGEIVLADPVYDIYSNTATYNIPGILTDGNYRATLTAGGVTNNLNMPITANEEINFFWLNGDLNRDRTVSISDFIDLASRFNQPATKWSDGDLNYDGQITISDFIDLAANFNHSIAPPAPAQAPANEAVTVDSGGDDSNASDSVVAQNESSVFKKSSHRKQSHHRRAHKSAPARRLSNRGWSY